MQEFSPSQSSEGTTDGHDEQLHDSEEIIDPKSAELELLRAQILERWINPEEQTDEQLLTAIREDGQLLVHVTGYAEENIRAGYFLPTVMRNLRAGKEGGSKALQHASEGMHFGLNEAYFRNKKLAALRIENRRPVDVQMIAFVAHPGGLMVSKDIKFGPQEVADLVNRSRLPDVVVRGRTDDPFDRSSELDVRSGFFLIPSEPVDPLTGRPSRNMTVEQYQQNYQYDPVQKQYFNIYNLPASYTPDQCAVSSEEYWKKVGLTLPTGQRPRLFFYQGEDLNEGLNQFRTANQIPNPNSEKFVKELELVGTSKVSHGDPKYATHGAGTGDFLRLKVNNQGGENSITINPKIEGQLSSEFRLAYSELKEKIDATQLTELDLQSAVRTSREEAQQQARYLSSLMDLQRQGETDEATVDRARASHTRLEARYRATREAFNYAIEIREARKNLL